MAHIIALVLSLVFAPQQLQSHPLVGVWKISYPWHVEMHNGIVQPTMETGELKVEARGDSLIATLVRMVSIDTPAARVIRLAALPGTSETVFVTRDLVTLSSSAGKREMTAVARWVFRVSGDQLSGTLQRRLEGANVETPGPQPLSGSRLRS